MSFAIRKVLATSLYSPRFSPVEYTNGRSFSITTPEVIECKDSYSAKHEGILVTPDLISELRNGSEIQDGRENKFLLECFGAAKYLLSKVDVKSFESVLESRIKTYVDAFRTLHEKEITVPRVSEIVDGTYRVLTEAFGQESKIFTFTPGKSTVSKILVRDSEANQNKFLVSFEDNGSIYVLAPLVQELQNLGRESIELGSALLVNCGTELFLQEQGVDPLLAHKISEDLERFLLKVEYNEGRGFTDSSPLNKKIKELVPKLQEQNLVAVPKTRKRKSRLKEKIDKRSDTTVPKDARTKLDISPVVLPDITGKTLVGSSDKDMTPPSGDLASKVADFVPLTVPLIVGSTLKDSPTIFSTSGQNVGVNEFNSASVGDGTNAIDGLLPLNLPVIDVSDGDKGGSPDSKSGMTVLRSARQAIGVLGL